MDTKITFISDTHNRHRRVNLPGGDILIHSGDISSQGYTQEVEDFLKWFEAQPYDHKIFIAGNHDLSFENSPEDIFLTYKEFKVTYLEDSFTTVNGIKIYGTPWQPEFYNWAFNLPRNGIQLEYRWNLIPEDTDILITHCPPFGIQDKVTGSTVPLGCELLWKHVTQRVFPTIHTFGHIHTGRGITETEHTTFVNASILNEKYDVHYQPISVMYNSKTKKISEILID